MVQDVISWNRDRARDVLGPGVRVAVAATEGGKPPSDAALGHIDRISFAAALLAALFDVLRRPRDTQQRYLALTGDALVLCDTALVGGRLAPGRELARVPRGEIVRRDSTSGMLVVTMPGRRELWVRSFDSQPLRDALRTGR